LLFVIGLPALSIGQQITYEYDALGRLTVVTTPEGVARYEYDAVGNILRITTRRSGEIAGPVAILLVNPAKGTPGTEVHIYGRGFAPAPGENQLAFNGTPATVTAATATSLVTTVPSAATTGPISLTTPLGSATSPEPFTILEGFVVVPDQADVALGASLGFRATLDGTPTTEVTWRVNGMVGGSAQLGTITSAGVYIAPTSPPSVEPVTIEAVLIAEPSRIASASVRVVGQVAGLIAARSVSVGSATAQSAQALAGPVSVATTAALNAQAPSGPLSVGMAAAGSAQTLTGPVTVMVAPAQNVLAGTSVLTVTGGPAVSALAPTSGTPGSALTLTLSGANLQGASAIQALRNGLTDSTLTVSSVTPATDGRSVTCSLSIGTTAPLGSRVLQVVTPQGRSTNFDVGTNVFTVRSP
jgi:YD repeat-containing protein